MRIHKYMIGLLLPALFIFAMNAQADAQSKSAKPKVQTARVLITPQGHSRTSINLRRDVETHLTFVRQTNETFANEVVIPDYGVKRTLPLDVPVAVSFTPKRSGEVAFTCGMNMYRGKLIVR